jgi:2-oxoisovalerate dehydrogenase E1 component
VIPFGEVGVTGDGTDLAIVTYGNGHYLTQQALPRIAAAGTRARVIDLRWLSPLPEASLLAAIKDCKRVLIVDECRRSGGPAEGLMTLMAEQGIAAMRVTSEDSFIATGPAYAATMPSVDSILAGALA